MAGRMGYKSLKRKDTHEEWGMEHVGRWAIWKGLPLKDGPLQEKKKGNGPKERKGKEAGPMGQPGRNQQQALES